MRADWVCVRAAAADKKKKTMENLEMEISFWWVTAEESSSSSSYLILFRFFSLFHIAPLLSVVVPCFQFNSKGGKNSSRQAGRRRWEQQKKEEEEEEKYTDNLGSAESFRIRTFFSSI